MKACTSPLVLTPIPIKHPCREFARRSRATYNCFHVKCVDATIRQPSTFRASPISHHNDVGMTDCCLACADTPLDDNLEFDPAVLLREPEEHGMVGNGALRRQFKIDATTTPVVSKRLGHAVVSFKANARQYIDEHSSASLVFTQGCEALLTFDALLFFDCVFNTRKTNPDGHASLAAVTCQRRHSGHDCAEPPVRLGSPTRQMKSKMCPRSKA